MQREAALLAILPELRAEHARARDETTISQRSVRPILKALGWPAHDAEIVQPEYQVGEGRRVDFALGKPARAFIEVKRTGVAQTAAALQQVHTYAADAPTETLLFLTDGLTWRLFVRKGDLLGTVVKLDLQRAADAQLLHQLLSRERILSGRALESARSMFNERGRIEDEEFQQYFTLAHIEVSPVSMHGRSRMEQIRAAARSQFGAGILRPASFEKWLLASPEAPKVRSSRDARKRAAQLFKNGALVAGPPDAASKRARPSRVGARGATTSRKLGPESAGTSDGLAPLPARFLSGDEPFRGLGAAADMSLSDYWQWSASCLMDNTARGLLAEFLVGTALEGYVRDQPRVEWEPYDFVASIGGQEITIEVKSSSKVQTWKQKRHSALQFGIAPSVKWDPETGKYSNEASRADIYVFCVLSQTKVGDHAAALDMDNWKFRVARSSELPDQRTVAWARLADAAGAPCGFIDLRGRIEDAAAGIGL